MKAVQITEWSCGSCDGVATGEPKWWPTLEKKSKFETSTGVCQPCFRLLMDQVKFENKKAKKAKKPAKSKKSTKKASKKTR